MVPSLTLLASGAITATSSGTAAVNLDGFDADALIVQLDVTAAALAVGDTLDMFVQTTVDGTNWVDIVHFTQVLGNGGVKRFFAKVGRPTVETMFENATALAAASVRNLLGNQFRTRYTIAGATPNFTVSVKANVL